MTKAHLAPFRAKRRSLVTTFENDYKNHEHGMKVLLINSNRKSDVLAAPPIGLCYVATATQRAGHDVAVVDLCFQRRPIERVRRVVSEFKPEVLGVSIRNIDNCNMLHPRSYLEEIKAMLNEIRTFTDACIVVGGSGASIYPKGVLEYLEADYIVVSEGEEAFPRLLEHIESGICPEQVPGVGFKRDGQCILNPPALTRFGCTRADVGRWIDLRPYQAMGSSYTIQSRRGCRNKCIYCTYNQLLEGQALRLRDPRDVVDEIEEAISRYRPRSFEFVDSVFNDPLDHCGQVLEEIITRPWKASFTAMGVSPRGLDAGFLQLMQRAGFNSFWVTPESASATMIRNYRKGFTLDDIVAAADAIRATKFTVLWDFLIGGPGETNHTLQETLDFILRDLVRDTRPPYYTINFFLGVRVYPGTTLWDVAMNQGFLSPKSDPLQQLWYVSPSLDLDQALAQMVEAARSCPEIISGIDEKYLELSGIARVLGKFFTVPQLYWRLMYAGNKMARKAALRISFDQRRIVNDIKRQLASQGYSLP